MERKDHFLISEEVAEWVGLKKSEYLSRIVANQEQDDIPFEEFHLYDSFIPSTIEAPDKIYEFSEDDHSVRTYLKTFSEKSFFHQVVIGVLINDKETRSDVFVPIITFVSRKNNLVKEFCNGVVISQGQLN